MKTAPDDSPDPEVKAAPESPDTGTVEAPRLGRTRAMAMAALRFELRWQSAHASHCDGLATPLLNLSPDLLPPKLKQEVLGQPVGHQASHRFAPGELIAAYQGDQLLNLRPSQFDRCFMRRGQVQPRNGRFYPKGILRDVAGVFESDRTPFRIATVDDDVLQADLNHPLADKTLELALTIESISGQADKRGGRRNEIHDLVTAGGPGMQARWRGLPTDFLSDLPFSRADPSPDAAFYRQPRFVDHIDRVAIGEISALYRRLIPDGARVLDLMASWHSHLPATLKTASVTGLGMNRAELDANPVLSERVVQDLNRDALLPFHDAAFDAAICTVSVEYLIKPFDVFRELARVLEPGGLLIVTFSNRWFPPKAIQIWEGTHEFERPGVVLEYFLESGLFDELNTWSLRGLPRPADDKYADRMPVADPVYAVWGRRAVTVADAPVGSTGDAR